MQAREFDLAANAACETGNATEALRHLTAANKLDPDPEREVRIRDLRITTNLYGERTPPVLGDAPAELRFEQDMPTCALSDVTPEIVRAAFKARGCLYVPRAIDKDETERLRQAIENTHCASVNQQPDPRWNNPPRMPTRDESLKMYTVRTWANQAGGCLAIDSPGAMYLILDMLERHGIRDLAERYLGEAPVMSASKFMLWKVPGEGGETDWHQDGRFLGDDIESINVWTALTDCGESAPGMELVLEDLDHYVMQEQNDHFDWCVSDKQVDEFRKRVPVVIPKFKAGDMLMFDHWLLHRTSRLPGMTDTRYAIESWFFAPSVFPRDRVAMIA